MSDQPFFYAMTELKFTVIFEPFCRASVTSHMELTGIKIQGGLLKSSVSALSCLLSMLLFFASCKGQEALVKQNHFKTASVLVKILQPIPVLLEEPANQVESASKTSLALASDTDSGSGFAIALSGDDLVSGSPEK